MAYTNFAAVNSVIEIDTDITDDAAAQIEAANHIVTKVCLPPVDSNGVAINDDTALELIERYLAAHFYCLQDARTTQERAGSVGESYEGRTGENLSWSRYGQQAMLLDTSGALAQWNAQVTSGATKRRARVIWGGRNPSEEERIDGDS